MSLVPTRLSQSLSPEHMPRESLDRYCLSCLVHFPRGASEKGTEASLQLRSHLEPCQGGKYSSDLSSQQRVASTAAPTGSRTLACFLELPNGHHSPRGTISDFEVLQTNPGWFPHLQLYFSLLWVAQRPCTEVRKPLLESLSECSRRWAPTSVSSSSMSMLQ